MKKLISFTLFLTIILLALVARNISHAQVIVAKAAPMVIVRPACPKPGYVWADGYYRWNRRMNQHIWVNGYWGRPHFHRRGIRSRVW